MKLTTKIVAGIIFSIFILSFCFIILLPHISKEKPQINQPAISQENIISVDVEPYQTIWINEAPIVSGSIYPEGRLQLKPVINEGERNKLFLPEELLRFTDITSSNDTLIIRLKIDEMNKQYNPNQTDETVNTDKEVRSIWYGITGANFYVHTNTVDVVCKYGGIKVDVRNIITDRINIQTHGSIEIDSCRANLVEPYMFNRRNFTLKNSQVKELNIDLDQIGSSWRIENCDIEVENLTGSNKHNVNLSKSEAKIMNWFPKSKEARLTVTLYGDTARIEFP